MVSLELGFTMTEGAAAVCTGTIGFTVPVAGAPVATAATWPVGFTAALASLTTMLRVSAADPTTRPLLDVHGAADRFDDVMAGLQLGFQDRIRADRRGRRNFLALVVEAHDAPLDRFMEHGPRRDDRRRST